LSLIVNTGDDFDHLGLHISPDLDTVMYTLAGLANPTTGWGVKDESWNMMAALARYGQPTWFQLGDRDLATHLLRSKWLREGYPYNWVTRELSKRLGVRCTILPMSENPVRTMIMTKEGEIAFQEYFVQKQCQPVVKAIRFAGIEAARPSREVASALRNADVIIFCPSNPLLSLDPILALPTLGRIIAASRVPKIAVSPIVGGIALKGPAAKIMTELGMEVSPIGVAQYLKEVLTGFVLDHVDQAYQDEISDLGLRTLVTGTIMTNNEDRVRLAQEVLDFAQVKG
ncbi:MAG TPA: 2-phospho-L-lactate transferase, partial [Anaerolineae bacterium]|nr:2-phospho-L-lactate transferase [Anaerolineae bacterium]